MSSEKELYDNKKEILESYMLKRDELCPQFGEYAEKGMFEEAFHVMCEHMEIRLNEDSFVYFLDFGYQFNTSIQNITPDYGIILHSGLYQLLYDDSELENVFCRRYNSVLEDVLKLIERIQEELELRKPENYQEKKRWFGNMAQKQAESFCEALQRVLFVNQLLWQTGSTLVGLGRLDALLYPYYKNDLACGRITEDGAVLAVKEFLTILHQNYWFKSAALMGDTGQVIVLGGLEQEDVYCCNDLTYLFLKSVEELKFSDPKLVLRVSRHMPKKLMSAAVDCMKTGNGSPLLSNDDIVIPCLEEFGIAKTDAYAYATSACWEPLIAGKSSAMNNQAGLAYLRALKNLLIEERVDKIENFEVFKKKYLFYLKYEIRECLNNLKCQKYKRNTIYSVFIDGCKENKKDIVDGGAIYHNIGMTTVGLGNTVNSLLNIKKLVFETKKYSLVDVKRMSILDFEGSEEIANILKESEIQYGKDSTEALELTNEILRFVTEQTKDFHTATGGKVKFGVSSPAYIMDASRNEASFDGRRKGEPLTVHISNENASSYTEIINFAAGLDYAGNRFNGNVVDLMVNPSFIENHQDKFCTLLLQGIEAGFFQLQTNVIGSETLIRAKAEPEKFPGLIVRVWGFSAYFVELPENYQDLLIRRALRNEGKTA